MPGMAQNHLAHYFAHYFAHCLVHWSLFHQSACMDLVAGPAWKENRAVWLAGQPAMMHLRCLIFHPVPHKSSSRFLCPPEPSEFPFPRRRSVSSRFIRPLTPHPLVILYPIEAEFTSPVAAQTARCCLLLSPASLLLRQWRSRACISAR